MPITPLSSSTCTSWSSTLRTRTRGVMPHPSAVCAVCAMVSRVKIACWPSMKMKSLPGQVLRGRGGHPSHADGHDAGRRPRAVKTSPLERFFRDGAVAPVQFPPRDLCLSTLGMFELGLDPGDVLPPLKSDRSDTGPVVR